MSESRLGYSVVGLLTLREVRGYLRRSHALGMAVFIAVAYALGSMVLGGMLVFARFSGGYSVLLLWGNALGLQSWNYPGLLIEAPWGVIELPFFATLSMILVSAGVGMGMAVAILLGVQQIRNRRSPASSPAATGTIAGLTPALIALVTLGACCSTTAAATAGVGLVAQASGSSTSNLLLNNWYLGVFQIVVVYTALIAQDLLLRVYARMFGAHDPGFASAARPSDHRLDRRALPTAALRAALLAGGVTWSLAVIAEWTSINPSSASPALWFNWLVEHWLIGGIAMFWALSPRSVGAWFLSVAPRPAGRALRAAFLLGAGTLALWVPPPFAAAGVEGFGNELLGILGVSSSWGAVGPAFPWGLTLALRWGFQYLLLAAFAGAVALAPERTLNWLSEGEPVGGRPGTVESVPSTTVAAPLEAR